MELRIATATLRSIQDDRVIRGMTRCRCKQGSDQSIAAQPRSKRGRNRVSLMTEAGSGGKSLQMEAEPDVGLNGELHRDDRLSLRRMTGRFEHFDARPGGSYRLVLAYADASAGRLLGETAPGRGGAPAYAGAQPRCVASRRGARTPLPVIMIFVSGFGCARDGEPQPKRRRAAGLTNALLVFCPAPVSRKVGWFGRGG